MVQSIINFHSKLCVVIAQPEEEEEEEEVGSSRLHVKE
jgi:hypothetical protein